MFGRARCGLMTVGVAVLLVNAPRTEATNGSHSQPGESRLFPWADGSHRCGRPRACGWATATERAVVTILVRVSGRVSRVAHRRQADLLPVPTTHRRAVTGIHSRVLLPSKQDRRRI